MFDPKFNKFIQRSGLYAPTKEEPRKQKPEEIEAELSELEKKYENLEEFTDEFIWNMKAATEELVSGGHIDEAARDRLMKLIDSWYEEDSDMHGR